MRMFQMRCWLPVLVGIGGLFHAAAPAAAFQTSVQTVYAIEATDPNSDDWRLLNRAEGAPDDRGAANSTSSSTVPLRAVNFEPYTLPLDHEITNVRVDVRTKYQEGTTGNTVTVRVVAPWLPVSSNNTTPSWNQTTTNFKWRFGAPNGNSGWNVTGLKSSWSQQDVRDMNVWVRRTPGAPPKPEIRIDAFRIVVESRLIDSDGDGVTDRLDNCPTTPNANQADTDNDGIGDACDPCTDRDNDGVCDPVDNCPTTPNANQSDLDGDGIGDACDPCTDRDNDGVCDPVDNCPTTPNANQADADNDGIGDACDPCTDRDNDGVCDPDDNCPTTPNANQDDADSDGIGDACDPCTDRDNDNRCDEEDNCPDTPNFSQRDTDNDGIGDACDPCTDRDNDGVCDPDDNCPTTPNANQDDADSDGFGDDCDTCPDVFNPGQGDPATVGCNGAPSWHAEEWDAGESVADVQPTIFRFGLSSVEFVGVTGRLDRTSGDAVDVYAFTMGSQFGGFSWQLELILDDPAAAPVQAFVLDADGFVLGEYGYLVDVPASCDGYIARRALSQIHAGIARGIAPICDGCDGVLNDERPHYLVVADAGLTAHDVDGNPIEFADSIISSCPPDQNQRYQLFGGFSGTPTADSDVAYGLRLRGADAGFAVAWDLPRSALAGGSGIQGSAFVSRLDVDVTECDIDFADCVSLGDCCVTLDPGPTVSSGGFSIDSSLSGVQSASGDTSGGVITRFAGQDLAGGSSVALSFSAGIDNTAASVFIDGTKAVTSFGGSFEVQSGGSIFLIDIDGDITSNVNYAGVSFILREPRVVAGSSGTVFIEERILLPGEVIDLPSPDDLVWFGSVGSPPLRTCAADMNRDGTLDFFDVITYDRYFDQQHRAAEFTGDVDGVIDSADVLAFLTLLDQGCD